MPADNSSEAHYRRQAEIKKLLEDAESLVKVHPGQYTDTLLYWLRQAVAGPPSFAAGNDLAPAGPGQTPAEYREQCLRRVKNLAERTHFQLQNTHPAHYREPFYQELMLAAERLEQVQRNLAEPTPRPIPEETEPEPTAPAAASQPESAPPAAAAPPAKTAAAVPTAAAPPPELCQVLLEPAALLPAVKAGFPEALWSGIRFHGQVTPAQYIALTGDAALTRLKESLAFTGENEEGWSLPIPVVSLLTEENGWNCLQTQLFAYMIRQELPPYRCPEDQPRLLKVAKNLDELSYAALQFLSALAEAYTWQPFQLLEEHLKDALGRADPPLGLYDFIKEEQSPDNFPTPDRPPPYPLLGKANYGRVPPPAPGPEE